jgi:hypothetical protein
MANLVGTVRSGGSPSHALYEFASTEPASSVLEQLARIDDPSVVTPAIAESPVLQAVLECFSGATHLLTELDYFDSDHRSNASATLARRHQPVHLRTDRLVFIRLAEHARGAISLPEFLKHLAQKTTHVLGYVVINADHHSPVGRSLVPPPDEVEGVREGVNINVHVRTMVPERIAVCGRIFTTFGVPFMQQDGDLLTCAHVAAWQVHYNAMLRGLARRRLSADFHRVATDDLIVTRRFPSDGLTDWQVAGLLEEFGLPVETMDIDILRAEARTAEWFDRLDIWKLTAELEAIAGRRTGSPLAPTQAYRRLVELAEQRALDTKDPDEQRSINDFIDRLDKFWIGEILTRSLCQYLNSGFPAVLMDQPHAQVVNGYVRDHELAWADDSGMSVQAFITSDDQEGPYQLVRVSEVVESLIQGDMTILVPLPLGVWLRGIHAERIGTKMFREEIDRLLRTATLRKPKERADVTGLVRRHPESMNWAEVKQNLRRLRDHFRTPGESSRHLSVRSYVVTATDFRRGLSMRCKDPIINAKVNIARLPKFVWIVEVLDRTSKASADDGHVIGEIVLDATCSDPKDAAALIVHLPGLLQVKNSGGVGDWHVLASNTPYRSGRYHGKRDWMSDADSIVSRSKYTV